ADPQRDLLAPLAALAPEQLGHLYEALLDTTAARAKSPLLGLRGARGRTPHISLDDLEQLAAAPSALLARLRRVTGRATASLRRALASPPPTARARDRLLRACAGDEALCLRVAPWAALLRHDAERRPVVIPPGRLHLTPSAGRRATGTHYTPPELAGSIVHHALEPLCHHGPDDGLSRERWRLRSPAELLDLRICDLALGCGAFLIAACRYLAARLLESAAAAPAHDPIARRILADRADPDRLLRARHLVATHCLFGVDLDPLAVDIARRSLWLETGADGPPGAFLAHALVCGDSLLGLSSFDPLEHLHLVPARGRELHDAPLRLADFTPTELHTIADAITGAALHTARSHSHKHASTTDLITHSPVDAPPPDAASTPLTAHARDISPEISTPPPERASTPRAARARKRAPFPLTDPPDLIPRALACTTLDANLALIRAALSRALAESDDRRAAWFSALADLARRQLGHGPDGAPRTPFHWPLAFPDVLRRGGFSAVVGNPPFQGGQKISGHLGPDYREYLIRAIAGGRRGSADLCAYFFLRAAALTRTPGRIGLLATNTIAQGDTREVGLDQLVAAGLEIERAISSAPWP
ncbi:MAG TPA: DNA methyltransferase, partial [Nannocystis sp.]